MRLDATFQTISYKMPLQNATLLPLKFTFYSFNYLRTNTINSNFQNLIQVPLLLKIWAIKTSLHHATVILSPDDRKDILFQIFQFRKA